MRFLKLVFVLFLFASVAAFAQNNENKWTDFSIPEKSSRARSAILAQYDYLDPQNIVPTKALADAVLFFERNKDKINNQNYISVIDFTQSSRQKRFFIISMKTGAVLNIHVAHGKGSDPDHDGFATSFSNTSGTNKSSLGYYLTAESYYGDHGLSLRLDGLSSTNSSARSRAIVIHGAEYVQESDRIQGRSWGCPAVAMNQRDRVVNLLKNGALIYAAQTQ